MAALLLVDDDLRLRSHLARFLESRGHEVAVAGNGQEALDALCFAQERLLSTGKQVPTQKYNGYGAQVAQLYP